MTWDRSIAATTANAHCTVCRGRGLRWQGQPCGCVLRAVFRACYAKFKQQATGRFRRPSTYVADFVLVGKRALADPLEYSRELAVFKAHFLLGGDWKICCRQLKIDRGTFFHAVYHVEETLGRVFAETRPYALWPVAEYFGLKHARVHPCPVPAPVRRDAGPVRPPLARKQPLASPDPARDSVVPVLVPIAPAFDVTNPIAVVAYIRSRFRAGMSVRSIGLEMERLNVPTQYGKWGISTVRRVLLSKAA